ncbi:MAG: EAL domain-containing protein [Lachnospiraceae bacterium]|nr:EAL domain-containing protein [Lachnospiraceae bacterium]
MGTNIDNFEKYIGVFEILSKCTDDYLFILDFIEDHYNITKRATEIFNFEQNDFYNALSIIGESVYPDDREMLNNNIQDIIDGKSNEHDLEYRWINKSGNPVWISCRGQVVRDLDGRVRYLIGRISELGRKNKIDNITGLYREVRLRQDILKMDRASAKKGFLLLIGIDNFKDINERYNKEVGNSTLQVLAQCITEAVGESASVYRMSGDEIMVFCKGLDSILSDPAKEMYKKIRSVVDKKINEKGYRLFYTISGGSVYFTEEDNTGIQYIEKAEFALRLAKIRGKNMCVCYEKLDYSEYVNKLKMQEALRKAVENNFEGFELYYQPIVNMEKACIHGAEALLRWKNGKFGMVSPGIFIPLLEDSGLIIPVGRWVIEDAMRQCLEWQKICPGFRVNINISFVQIKKSNVISDIDLCMEKFGFDSKNVLFEITESGELETGYSTQNILESFHRRSLNLAIDDFGTGYSNLRYIKEMMFNLVKIDQAFIRGIRDSQYDYMVVKQFTELAHSLNLKVCYEGVETEEDFKCVRELEPDYIQGYYFSRPVTSAEFEEKYLGKENVF